MKSKVVFSTKALQAGWIEATLYVFFTFAYKRSRALSPLLAPLEIIQMLSGAEKDKEKDWLKPPDKPLNAPSCFLALQ